MDNLIIRADTDAKTGTGHLIRCLALAQVWKDAGGHVIFITTCQNENLIQKIKEITKEYEIEAFVLGLPYNMDGTEGPRAEEVRRFADVLTKEIPLPMDFFDERLSSFDAQEKLIGMELTRKGKKKRLDAVAAATILQAYLDAKK